MMHPCIKNSKVWKFIETSRQTHGQILHSGTEPFRVIAAICWKNGPEWLVERWIWKGYPSIPFHPTCKQPWKELLCRGAYFHWMDLKFLASLDAAIHSQDMTGPLRTFQYVVSGTFERRVLHNAGPIGFKAIEQFENPMSIWAFRL